MAVEQLAGLVVAPLANEQPAELDEEQRLAPQVDPLGQLEGGLDGGLGLVVAAGLLLELGLDAGQGEQPRGVVGGELDGAAQLLLVLVEPAETARHREDLPEQLECRGGIAVALLV